MLFCFWNCYFLEITSRTFSCIHLEEQTKDIIIIIIIRKLFNNGNPSAKAAFQGAVLLIIYKLTFQTTN